MSLASVQAFLARVCPFGLAHPLRVAPDRLAQLVEAPWVDVAQQQPAS